jgi:hypothetical protein
VLRAPAETWSGKANELRVRVDRRVRDRANACAFANARVYASIALSTMPLDIASSCSRYAAVGPWSDPVGLVRRQCGREVVVEMCGAHDCGIATPRPAH